MIDWSSILCCYTKFTFKLHCYTIWRLMLVWEWFTCHIILSWQKACKIWGSFPMNHFMIELGKHATNDCGCDNAWSLSFPLYWGFLGVLVLSSKTHGHFHTKNLVICIMVLVHASRILSKSRTKRMVPMLVYLF